MDDLKEGVKNWYVKMLAMWPQLKKQRQCNIDNCKLIKMLELEETIVKYMSSC